MMWILILNCKDKTKFTNRIKLRNKTRKQSPYNKNFSTIQLNKEITTKFLLIGYNIKR